MSDSPCPLAPGGAAGYNQLARAINNKPLSYRLARLRAGPDPGAPRSTDPHLGPRGAAKPLVSSQAVTVNRDPGVTASQAVTVNRVRPIHNSAVPPACPAAAAAAAAAAGLPGSPWPSQALPPCSAGRRAALQTGGWQQKGPQRAEGRRADLRPNSTECSILPYETSESRPGGPGSRRVTVRRIIPRS